MPVVSVLMVTHRDTPFLRPAIASVLSQTFDGDGLVIGREFSLTDGESQRRYTAFAAPVVTPAYTGRRAIFAALPYRAELPLAADFDFLARAAEQTSLGYVPEVLLRYRR